MRKFRDDTIFDLIYAENERQNNYVNLIASENFVSRDVMQANGSHLTNKYAEGYPGARYYAGCEIVDEIEKIAIERACSLFSCNFANVQPHSGSQANQAAYMALLKPEDTILSMSLDSGGHLTHGHKLSMPGSIYQIHHYGVDPESHLIDYSAVREQALDCKPNLIIAGSSAYARTIDFQKMRNIADEVGAYLLADIAHYAGLIAASKYNNPFPHCHIATTTTHKTLRGPRGGMIMCNDETIAKKINRALFPGIQGGPCMHTIAAKAIAFGEASTQEYKDYIADVLHCSRSFAAELQKNGCDIVSGGTDCHMFLVDLTKHGINGLQAQKALEDGKIICNKNTIPYDKQNPAFGSGIRLGVAASVTAGFTEFNFTGLAQFIAAIVQSYSNGSCDAEIISKCSEYVEELLQQHQ